MGAKALRSQSKQPESVSGEELDPSDWAQQAAKKLIKQEARRCRDCGGTLPPQRYFRCEYCIAPELLEDDMGSEWDHVEGL